MSGQHRGCALCKKPATGEVLRSIVAVTGKESIAVCAECFAAETKRRPDCMTQKEVLQ